MTAPAVTPTGPVPATRPGAEGGSPPEHPIPAATAEVIAAVCFSAAALAGIGFDGVVSSCVFGFEEDARGISERQRDKALALVAKHFGDNAGAAITSSKLK